MMFLLGCVEPYVPEVLESNPEYLVVEGLLNANGTASFRLSTTSSLGSTVSSPPLTAATVTIESSENETFPLTETVYGTYDASGMQLSMSSEYRLHIFARGQEYISDFVPLKDCPPIDSLNFSASEDGLDLHASTHDPNNNAHYYKWNFVETWQYSSGFTSTYRLVNGKLIPKGISEYRNICYISNNRISFAIESTTRFTEDRVSNFVIHHIEPRSKKLSRRYSILVRQQVLTEDAYRYWETLKKSSEQVGGLFDPLPSSLEGNIKCVSDPSKKVVGFFSASAVTEKRLFISSSEIPRTYPRYFNNTCSMDSVIFQPDVNYADTDDVIAPITVQIFVIGYTYSSHSCLDCTMEGGSVTKPDFWE